MIMIAIYCDGDIRTGIQGEIAARDRLVGTAGFEGDGIGRRVDAIAGAIDGEANVGIRVHRIAIARHRDVGIVRGERDGGRRAIDADVLAGDNRADAGARGD